MLRKTIFLCICILLLAANLFADTVTLKSGKQIEGKILEKNNELVRIDIEGVVVTYFLSDIDAINQKKIALSLPTPPVTLASQESAQTQTQVTAGKIIPSSGPALKTDNKVKEVAFAVGLVAVMFVSLLLIYIYYAICLQLIAKKTNHGPAWQAWVPIVNLFLMCKIAGINYLWLLVLLLSFIPIVSIVVSLGFTGFIWYRIALTRNKPGWIGILSIIPIVNFAIMGYLAFTD